MGVDNCNEQKDTIYRFKMLRDNHYYYANGYYESKQYEPKYISLIYDNDERRCGDMRTFITILRHMNKFSFKIICNLIL